MLCVGVLLIAGGGSASAASANKVLILAGTVTGGSSSVEATEAAAQGMAVDVVDAATWSSMTPAQFASYRAIILGDPTCYGPGTSPDINAAAANAKTWGPTINGNIVILGTDPVFHASQGGTAVTQRGVDFALAQAGKTGAYIALSCYYHETAPNTPVPLLDGIGPGGFTVTGVGCYNNAHIVAVSPALAGLSDAELSNWSCSVHEAFQTWPGSLVPLAIAKDFSSSFTASDGTQGPPYILAGGDVQSFPLSLSPLSDTAPAGTAHTVTATLLDDTTRAPVQGAKIGFDVISGPNRGVVGSCNPASCLTRADGTVSWTYASNGTQGADGIRAFYDLNGNGIADVGEPQTTAGMQWVGRPTSCSDAGKMLSDTPFSFREWSLHFGISACEGLVVSQVQLGGRLMAERMSLPYLNVVTCTSPSDISHCTQTTTRHITLRPNANEPQTDPSAYTHVELIGNQSGGYTTVPSPSSGPCYSRPACEKLEVTALYKVDLSPPPAPGQAQGPFIYITQKYEFYRTFKENQFKDIACEPAQNAKLGPIPLGFLSVPLPDCGRWKPLVTYSFIGGASTGASNQTLLVSVNAAQRLHYTPDALAVRAAGFFRDCDPTAPDDNCDLGVLEVYPPGHEQTAIAKEAIVRGLQASPTGSSTEVGRYDNLHMTPEREVNTPGLAGGGNLLGAGCPECAHMHWRWGSDLGAPPSFGNGQPLIGDAEPGAQPNPRSHQQLDVAVVAYHSEELSPYDFTQLVQGANTNDLNLTTTSSGDHYSGGFTEGTETLDYPPTSCSDLGHLWSWGQCGEVVWLSGTTYTVHAHDEDTDTLFAFGGFFCASCTSAPEVISEPDFSGLVPTYQSAHKTLKSNTVARGSNLTISFSGLGGDQNLYDVLPPGLTNVSGGYVNGFGETGNCPVTREADGLQVVHCDLSRPVYGNTVTISATVGASATPGSYNNTVHAIVWRSADSVFVQGGNYKRSDLITIK